MILKGKKMCAIIDSMLHALDERLVNQELYDDIVCNIQSMLELKKIYIEVSISSNQSKFQLKDKNTNDCFEIAFCPNTKSFSKITTNFSYFGGKNVEISEVNYLDDIITVDEIKLKKKVNRVSLELDSIEKNTQKSVYVDNTLIYQYQFESTVKTNFNEQTCQCSEETLFVSGEKAVSKRAVINEDDDLSLEYHTFDYCKLPAFNTRDDLKTGTYIYGMSYIKEEEYNRFINESVIFDKLIKNDKVRVKK